MKEQQEYKYCYRCDKQISKTTEICPECDAQQDGIYIVNLMLEYPRQNKRKAILQLLLAVITAGVWVWWMDKFVQSYLALN